MGAAIGMGVRRLGLLALPLASLALGGCFGFGNDAPLNADPVASGPAEGQIDIRKYLGPDYCPEIRVREGTEIMRTYERGFQDDKNHVVWQAAIGETARECLYDGQGNLILRLGISGRLLAGPKGGPGTVTLPVRVAIAKYREAVLFSELYPLAVTIPPQGSTVFTEVREIILPSPGRDRDYIIYLGFDESGKGFDGIASSAAASN